MRHGKQRCMLAPGLYQIPILHCGVPQALAWLLSPTSVHCSYATTDAAVVDTFNEADAFSKLSAAATKVAQQQAEMPAADIASMYIALLGFTGKVYPDKLDYTDRVLTECHQARPHLHHRTHALLLVGT